MEELKNARKDGKRAYFSGSEPEKLNINGKHVKMYDLFSIEIANLRSSRKFLLYFTGSTLFVMRFFISHLMGIPCLIFSHSGERASGGLMNKAVACAHEQFFWSKRYVGFINQFSPSAFVFILCPCSFIAVC